MNSAHWLTSNDESSLYWFNVSLYVSNPGQFTTLKGKLWFIWSFGALVLNTTSFSMYDQNNKPHSVHSDEEAEEMIAQHNWDLLDQTCLCNDGHELIFLMVAWTGVV